MRQFDLKGEMDLEKIRNLSGNDKVVLNVYSSFHPKKMKAVNLQNFSGTLRVRFCYSKPISPIIVYVEQGRETKWIFKNVGSATIKLPKTMLSPVTYHIPRDFIPVFDEKDFLESKRNKSITFSYRLNQDIICTRSLKDLFGTFYKSLEFYGNGQTIYFPKTKECEKFIKNHSLKFCGVYPVLVDQVVLIHTKEDFQKLRHLENGVVVVCLENNLCDMELESISLKNFTGTMIFYGKNHHLHHVTLWSREDSIGLFSSVHPTSTLIFRDLVMSDVMFHHFDTQKYFGTVLGARERVSEAVHSHFMPGGIHFSNCHVLSVQYPKSQETSKLGYFVGYGDDAMDFDKCYGVNGTDLNQNNIYHYVGEEDRFLTSSCYNIYEKSYLRKKRK